MTAFEELQRCQDQAIAFSKNRLDLALVHQKEMTALFFKVTIGYFAILYGVFLIYKILYDTHLENSTFLNNLLYLILFFFSLTFFIWGLRSLVVLYSLDLRVSLDQKILDRELFNSIRQADEDFREFTFQHNSQTLLLILVAIILMVPVGLCLYTFWKMPQNGWQWICIIFVLGLFAINVYFDHRNDKKSKQKTQQRNDLANENPSESH